MTDAEFRREILDALRGPITEDELLAHGAQNAQEYASIYLARIDRVVHEYETDKAKICPLCQNQCQERCACGCHILANTSMYE